MCSLDSLQLVGVQGHLVAFRGLPPHPTAFLASSIADLWVGQLSDWVKGRNFALGSISYVLGVWILLGEFPAMFILASLHILKVQRSRKASDVPSVTICESPVWNARMGVP